MEVQEIRAEAHPILTLFKIGGIGPTTGDAAIYGTAVKNGIQLAVDEINAGRRN